MPKNSNQTIVLGGDFNLPGIDWNNGVVNPKAANKSQCELLLSSLDTHALAQIHKEPTREENILDLLITNNFMGWSLDIGIKILNPRVFL